MGYDKYGIDWSVFGTDKPKAESSANSMQDSIGKGWGPKDAAAPVEDSDSADSEAGTSSTAKSVRITSAKFLPDAETDFLKECKIQIEAQGDPSVGEVALWGTFNGTDYDLRLSKTVDFTDGIAESTIPLEHVDEFYNEYYSNGNSEAFIDYFFYVSCSGAEKKKSDLLRMPLQQLIECDFVELHDLLFHHNCALPCLDDKGEIIALLAQVFVFAKDNSDRELIVEGHADTSGDPDYNLKISRRRAEAIKGLLANDMSLWNGVVTCSDHKLETEDYQQTLKSLAAKYGWSCDPGAVDNEDGPKTKAGVKAFQTEYKSRYKKELEPDGIMGPKTWEAIGIMLRSLLEEHLKTSLKLDPIPALTYGYADGNGIYPCGESCPIENPQDHNYRSKENRRVELVFYKKGDPQPAVAPTVGRKIGIKKDPVSEKEWDKKAVPPAAPAPVVKEVKVSIKAEDGTSNPLAVLKNGATIKFNAIASPAGGIYKWSTAGSISIVGSSSNQTVEIKGNTASTIKEDSTITVEYESSGTKATANFKMTVCTVTITPASMHANESQNSGTFTVDVKPATLTVTAYKWLTGSAENAWPASAGNLPALNYSTPTNATTIVNNTRWFAKTPSRLISVDAETCTYKINCEVTINGNRYRADQAADLNVEVINFFGSTCRWPEFQNWASIIVAKDASNVWRVTGQGSFSRRAPVVSVVTLPSSQFYNKVWEHENLHFNQWTSQSPWQNLFDANSLYSTTIQNLTSNVSEADLRRQIFQAVRAQENADTAATRNTKCQREHAAWVHENTIVPKFLELTLAGWKSAYSCP